MVQLVWEFIVNRNKLSEFERDYSSVGAWAALFGKSPGYRGTVLLRDAERPGRYLTIDSWDAPELYQAMRKKFATEFEELDHACETLTEIERRLGVFEVR